MSIESEVRQEIEERGKKIEQGRKDEWKFNKVKNFGVSIHDDVSPLGMCL